MQINVMNSHSYLWVKLLNLSNEYCSAQCDIRQSCDFIVPRYYENLTIFSSNILLKFCVVANYFFYPLIYETIWKSNSVFGEVIQIRLNIHHFLKVINNCERNRNLSPHVILLYSKIFNHRRSIYLVLLNYIDNSRDSSLPIWIIDFSLDHYYQ